VFRFDVESDLATPQHEEELTGVGGQPGGVKPEGFLAV
jgi:hypothetical protein